MTDILVIGSLNMDMTLYVDRFPQIGETISCSGMLTAPGGKGSNQALAAARLGAQVQMAGCVGCDLYGQALVDNLNNNGVDTTLVKILPGADTGLAAITVSNGANMILLNAGANACFTPADMDAIAPQIAQAKAVILQLEIPMAAVLRAAEIAHANGCLVVLNPAPYQPLPTELLAVTDYLIPNETEAMALLGWDRLDESNAAQALETLHAMGVKHPLITLGDKGVAYIENNTPRLEPCFKVDAVDTTAAGDTFIGGVITRMLSGDTLSNAVSFAQRASALCVSRKGAQTSIPTLAEVESYTH